MRKSITVPDLGNYPVILWLNGRRYGPYKVGEEVSVPDEVADFLEELAEERNKSVPPDPDAAPATVGDVKALIAEATEPVTIDLSGEDSGITYDAEEDTYFGDASIDWAPMIEACKAGKVMLTDENENGAFGTAVNGWYTEELNGVEYFVFYGDDGFRPVHLPVVSEEGDEGGGGLAPLPFVPGGTMTLKLPATNSGE